MDELEKKLFWIIIVGGFFLLTYWFMPGNTYSRQEGEKICMHFKPAMNWGIEKHCIHGK
jgi:ABC-type uncharacterized transport system permease subunit